MLSSLTKSFRAWAIIFRIHAVTVGRSARHNSLFYSNAALKVAICECSGVGPFLPAVGPRTSTSFSLQGPTLVLQLCVACAQVWLKLWGAHIFATCQVDILSRAPSMAERHVGARDYSQPLLACSIALFMPPPLSLFPFKVTHFCSGWAIVWKKNHQAFGAYFGRFSFSIFLYSFRIGNANE